MRILPRGGTAAGILAIAATLGTTGATSAVAWPAHETAVTAPAVGSETTVATMQQHYLAHLQQKLDWLSAWSAALRTRVDALPSDTVLKGKARLGAERKLAFVTGVRRYLAALPETGTFAATAAQRAQAAAIDATLAHVAGRLTELLANAPAVAEPVVKPVLKVAGVRDDRFARWSWWGHDCDRIGDRAGDRSWSGWDGWDRHHRR